MAAAKHRKKIIKLKAKDFAVAAAGKATVSLKLPKKLRTRPEEEGQALAAPHRRRARPGRQQRTVKKTLKPKLKRKRRSVSANVPE